MSKDMNMGQDLAEQNPHPISIQDMYRLKMVTDPQLSPAGDQVAFTVVQPQREQNDYTSRLYLVDAEGGPVVQLTNGERDESPRWSPDGKHIAFVSNRSGTNQLWVISTAGGEALQLTDLDGPVEAPAWAPDGRNIAFTHRVLPGKQKPEQDAGGYVSDVLRYSRLQYKWNGEGFWDGKWRQIWTVGVAGGQPAGEPVQLTEGPYDHQRPAWSPDGQKLAFAADRRTEADLDNKSDIHVMDVESRELTQLTDNDGPATVPTWSPDGTRIAYLGNLGEYNGATVTRAWVVQADRSEAPRCVTEHLDRNLGAGPGSDISWGSPDYGPVWAANGNSLFVPVVDRGTFHVWEHLLERSESSQVTSGKRAVHGVSFSTDRSTLAFVATHPLNPGDLYLLDRDTGEERQLTHVNDELLSNLKLSEPENMQYKGADGWDVEGWIMKPVGFEPGHKYPAVLKIHGGPHGAYGYTFSIHSQLLAGAGYAVIFTNPRGSTGYGQDFVKATHLDWGGGDYEDIMAGVDCALGLGYTDRDQLGVTGLSFGGYMTNWIVSHTGMFRVAVTEVTTSNRYSQWGTSDYGFGNGNWEFQGYPWASCENAKQYLERSPLTYVENISTPLLIIQAKEDHRCPLEQAEQLYTAMKVLKKECELAIFPDESHVFSRSGQPRHREERLAMVLDWFGRYLEA